MSETRKLTCIVCPRGCQIKAVCEDGKLVEITGYTCPRGKEYAESECLKPVRTLTTTIRIDEGEILLLPVKTEKPVNKHLLMDMMTVINNVRVKAPVSLGQVIIPNILETGVDIVATRPVKKIQS